MRQKTQFLIVSRPLIIGLFNSDFKLSECRLLYHCMLISLYSCIETDPWRDSYPLWFNREQALRNMTQTRYLRVRKKFRVI